MQLDQDSWRPAGAGRQADRRGGDRALSETSILAVASIYIMSAAALYPAQYHGVLVETFQRSAGPILTLLLLILAGRGLIVAPQAPLQAMIGIVRERSAFILLSTMVFVLGLAAYTTYKINLPDVVAFYADPALARLVRLLHGGNPWQVI